MNVQMLKRQLPRTSWVLYAVAAVLAAATAARGFAHVVGAQTLDRTVEQFKTQSKPDEQKTKDLLGENKKAADALKKKNVFVPPPPKPQPPTCQGILGDRALFGDNLHKVGDNVGGAQIVSINPTTVVIKWEDKDMTLVPFEGDNRSSGGPGGPGDRGRGGPPRPDAGQRTAPPQGASNAEVQSGPPQDGPRGGFMNMSAEERQQMIDRFRNMSEEERQRFREEQRQRFGGGPDRGGGGPDRGGDRGGFGRRGGR